MTTGLPEHFKPGIPPNGATGAITVLIPKFQTFGTAWNSPSPAFINEMF